MPRSICASLLLLAFASVGSLAPSFGQTPPLCLDEDQDCSVQHPPEPDFDFDFDLGTMTGGQPAVPSDSTLGGALPDPGVTVGSAGDFAFDIRASRTFVGPHVFPPDEYAAYGIVAFPELSSSATRDRHLLVCEAYVATLPQAGDLFIPPSEQMVTVWPVNSEQLASDLAATQGHTKRLTQCESAVDNYDLETALTAIRQAGKAKSLDFSNQGPFLLAWSPASDKGSKDALVLVADLSDVRTSDAMRMRFREWRDRIEQDESLWNDGWTIDRLRVSLRDWADHWGGIVFSSGQL